MRLVFADFDGDEGAVGVGDVGRVGCDDFELLIGDGGEEVALEEADVVGAPKTFCVEPGNRECTFGDVDRGDISEAPPVVSDRNRTIRLLGFGQRSSLRARSAMMFFWTSVGPAPIVVYRCHT